MNSEHVSIVQQGAKKLASWRQANPSLQLDLPGADLSRLDLSTMNLEGANLEGTILHQSTGLIDPFPVDGSLYGGVEFVDLTTDGQPSPVFVVDQIGDLFAQPPLRQDNAIEPATGGDSAPTVRLSRIRVKNLRRIKSLDVVIPDKTNVICFVGPNGAGKSTLMSCMIRSLFALQPNTFPMREHDPETAFKSFLSNSEVAPAASGFIHAVFV